MNMQDQKSMDKYLAFIQSHPKGHFMQSPEWAKVKSFWQNEIVVVEDEKGDIKGSMSVLIRKVPFLNCSMMYSPRGPVCDPHDYETLQALFRKVKQLAKVHRSYVLKMDPDIEIQDTEFENNITKLGCKVKRDVENIEGAQPRFVFRLDVQNKTEDEIMAAFHQKVRYNIRLSQRKGVECKIGTREDLAQFHKLIVETAKRDDFIVRNQAYYEEVFDRLGPEHVRLYMACYEGELIAATISILYGNKCWYLYGASSNEKRNLMPNYLLQWNMIKWAIGEGCDIYDFRGVPGDLTESNPFYGVYRFKVGFKGKYTEFIGTVEYVFKPSLYLVVEKGLETFMSLRRKLFSMRNKKG